MQEPAQNVHGEHIDDDLLEQYALHQLGEPGTAKVEEHLLICEYCCVRLNEQDAYVGTLRAAMRQSPPAEQNLEASRVSGRLGPVWAIAAAVVAVLGVAAYLVPSRQAVIDPVPVQLRATRGEPAAAVAIAGAPLELRLDLTGLADASSDYRVQIVDTAGQVIFTATARSGPGGAVVKTPPVASGAYWVRLWDSVSGELVREYNLKVNR